MSRRRRRARSGTIRNTLRLGIVLTLLVGINVYVFFFKSGTSLKDVKEAVKGAQIPATQQPAAMAGQAPSAKAGEGSADPGSPTAGKTLEGTIKAGDSLLKVFERAGVGMSEANEVVEALKPVMDFKTIREGQAWF